MELKIYDDLVASQEKEEHLWFTGTNGISFTDIDDFISQIPADDNNIDLLLHCRGGSVSEGWAMIDKLRATGKVITGTVDGMCASMAVSLLLAASERKAHKHATLHIHKPYIPGFYLDAAKDEDLKKAGEDLQKETQKMLDWYVERTGADRATLEALMAEDRDISAEEAKELGFVHEIIEPISAKLNNHKLSNKYQMENKRNILSELAGWLGLKVNIEPESPVNYVLKTEDGSEITINKPEGEDIAIGDPASPDGEFVLEDGRTVVIVDGVVTEIKPAEPEPQEPDNALTDEEEAQLKAENEALKAQVEEQAAKIAELEAKVAELEGNAPNPEDRAIVEIVNKCGGAAWLDGVARSTYTPAARNTSSKQAQSVSSMAKRIEELKAKQTRK